MVCVKSQKYASLVTLGSLREMNDNLALNISMKVVGIDKVDTDNVTKKKAEITMIN